MGASLDKFTRQVVDSGLMSADDVRAAVSGAATGARPEDGKQLARLLVRQKRLTAFQAQQIYSGKGASLVLGNYVILDQIGQGGMGLVFKAEHRRMKRLVALKVLSPAVTRDPEATRRFQREVEAAAKLEHPHIVTAFDADEAGGTHFLVMQYVEGTDLAALVRSRGTLDVDKAVSCILQAARGLEYAHARGVIHRDIKPSNLLLEQDGTVKILDMGLARLDSDDVEQATEDQLTGTGQIMGTIDYMAPEQALDTHTADARADLYSLGCTLWYLLTGRAVYGGDTVVKKLMAHQSSPPPSLREACGRVSPELDAVFTRMIAKTPEARYQSMTEVIAELQRCTGGPAAAPTRVAAPGEDSRFSEFLRGLDSSVPATTAARTATKRPAAKQRPAAVTGVEQTVTIQSADVESDPQTQRTLISPLAAPLAATLVEPHAETEIARPRRQAGGAWRRNRKAQIAAAALALLLGAIVLFVQTEEGTIRVEINDPAIEVAIKGTDIVLKQADKGKDVTLSPGEKTLVVQRGDFQFETDKLILKEGERVTVRVDLLAGDVQVRQGDKLLGRHALPSKGRQPPVAASPTLSPDRAAAEYVLSIGGTVRVNGEGRDVKQAGELPPAGSPLRLTWVGLAKNPQVSDAGLACFQGCGNLTQLDLERTKITDAGLAHFRDCNKLNFLDVVGCRRITDAGLAHFEDCQKLRMLFLSQTSIGDAGLAHFKDCNDLRSVWLGGSRIGDAGLAHLGDCKNLGWLELMDTRITDAGLAHFKDCKKLRFVYLQRTQVTDAGLEHCTGWTAVAYIELQKTKVTEAGVKKLAAALPQCKIEWDGGVVEPGDPERKAAPPLGMPPIDAAAAVDLLDLVDPAKDSLVFNDARNEWEPGGGWERLPTGWQSGRGRRELLRLAHAPTAAAYTLTVDLQLVDGRGGVWIVLPVGRTECFFAYNGFPRDGVCKAGFGYVDDKPENQNDTTVSHPTLPNGSSVQLVLDVDFSGDKATIVARAAGKELTRFEGPLERLSIPGSRDFADGAFVTFAVGSTNSRVLYRHVELTEFPSGRPAGASTQVDE